LDINVQILFFANLRERFQKTSCNLTLPPGTKAGKLFEFLFSDKEEAEQWSRFTRLAVNQSYVTADTPLKNGDEVALIPPVAGG